MSQQMSYETFSGGPAVNYERYFVPAIGAPIAEDLIAVADVRSGESVLDVACGTGVVTRLAAERAGDATVAAVDVNPGMLQVAREVSGDLDIEWREASAEALPLEDRSFDVVLCQISLQFFPDRPGALREMHRVLRPGGRVVINTPGPIPPAFAVLEQVLRRHIGPPAGGFVTAVFSLHDEVEFGELLGGAGFTDVRARSQAKTLHLPPARHFLWQYVNSTPMANLTSQLDEHARGELERDFASGCEPFASEDELLVEVGVTTATGRKA